MCQQCFNGCITTLSVTLDANGKGKFPTNNTLEKSKVKAIGIRRPTGSAGSMKDVNGNSIISATAFDAGFITLKKGSTAQYDQTPLAWFGQTATCCDMRCVDLPDGFDSNACEVKISDPSLIAAGQVVEITFLYDCNC